MQIIVNISESDVLALKNDLVDVDGDAAPSSWFSGMLLC